MYLLSLRILIMKRKWQNSGFISGMLAPSLIMLSVFTIYPLASGIIMAFQDYNLFNINDTKWVGFDNFIKLFETSPLNSFPSIIGNTVRWVLVSLVFQFLIGFLLAMLLRKRFRGSSVYRGIIFFPWAISGFIIGIMWRWMFNGSGGVINDLFMRLGLITQPVGWLSETSLAMNSVIVANIWYGIPFFTIMITAALAGIPNEVYEAADLDGAGPFLKFTSITLPYISSILILTVLLRFIWIFNFPDLIYSMTNGGPGGSTHIITSYMMERIMGLDYGMGSAVGVLVIVFLSVFSIIYLEFTKFENLGDAS